MLRRIHPGVFALLGTCLLLACPSNNGGEDAGHTEEVDSGEPPVEDAGPGDAGFTCKIDQDCIVLAEANPAWAGLRCDNDPTVNGSLADGGDVPSFTCIPGTTCNNIDGCQSFEFGDYCLIGTASGVGCYCNEEQGLDAGGVCLRRKSACGECSSSTECGDSSSYFDPPGTCKQLQGDSSGKTYCFQQTTSSGCPAGMKNDGAGYCIPQSGSCENVGCFQDSDCPGGSVCNQENRLCQLRCRWNFDQQDNIPACAPGYSCWVDEQNIDSASPLFGAGRCKPACSTQADCAYGGTFADGGQKLACKGEHVDNASDSTARCRPNGECMDDLECPDPGASIPSTGYCDRATFTCKNDCRNGIDPTTGNPYSDCKPGYTCKTQNNVNSCVLQTCVEAGGAAIACPAGNFCHNEDRNNDGTPDPAPSTAQKDAIGCYPAPMPPYCQTCTDDLSCATYDNLSTLPNLCVYQGDKTQGGNDGVFMCELGAVNDFARDPNTGVISANRYCPAGWLAQGVKVDMTPQGIGNCDTDTDCQKGNSSGVCATDLKLKLQDGGFAKSCFCNHAGTQDCPVDADAGVYSFCLQGLYPNYCVKSVVCEPRPGYAYQPVGNGGCGL